MTYVIIGLICSAVGCKWFDTDYGIFQTERECLAKIGDAKPKTAMYFDMKCRPIKPPSTS